MPHGRQLNDDALEIGSRGGEMPTSVIPIRSLLAHHVRERLAGAAEAAPLSLVTCQLEALMFSVTAEQ
jgi:hypothetical protein